MADLTANIAIKILDAFTGPLRKAQHELEEVEKRGERVRKAMSFAADLNQAAEAMGRFSRGILDPLRGAVDEFADFDHALSRMAAVSDEQALRGSANFELLKQQAVDLGASTQYSAKEVTELQTEYLKANFSVQEAAAVTEQTLAAATAEGIGLAETSAIVSGALRGMGLAVSETARVTDVLSKMSVKSKTDMRGLGEALGYAAGPASQLGLSIESTAAMLAVLANNNIEGSRGGTSLNAVLKGIVRKPGRDEIGAWEQLKITTKDLVVMRKALTEDKPEEALRRIQEGLKNLSKDKQVQVLQRLFGDEGAGAAGFLIRASVDASDVGLGSLESAARDAQGSVLKAADIMQKDLKGAMERAGGAISGLKTQIGEALAPAATEAAGAVEAMAGGVQAFVKDNPKFSKATLELVAGLGLTTLGLQGLLTWTSAMTSANAFLQASYLKLQASLMGRLGLVAAAGAAGYALGSWIDEILGISKALREDMLGTKIREERGMPTGEEQTLAGGWRLSPEGMVLEEGSGPGPVEVQRARAAGATTREEINAVIAAERKARAAGKPFSVVPTATPRAALAPGRGSLMEQYARDASLLQSPTAGVQTESQVALALREEFRPVLEELRKQTLIARKQADEFARRNGLGDNLDLAGFGP